MADLVRDQWLLLLVVAGVVLTVAMVVTEDAPVARRVFSRFVFNIALPLLIIVGVPLVALWLNTDLPEGIWQAIIAGVVIAGGWLTTAIFAELGKAKGKAERLRDYHKAIYAEIGNALFALWDEGDSERYVTEIIARMKTDDSFVPFIPREHHDHIYDAIIDEIEVLPRQTIDAIVAYYSLTKGIAALAEDMRGDAFRALPQARRITVYEDYWSMRKQAFDFGQHTLALILAYSDRGAMAAQAIADAVNSPDAARSARSEGSA